MPPNKKPVTAGANGELRKIAPINIFQPPAIFLFPRPGARLFVGELGERHDGLRRKSVDQPAAIALSAITKAIVQSIRPPLPELNRFRHDPVSAPMRRKRDRPAFETFRVTSASCASSASRFSITSLCCEAQAPSWLPSGRE